MTLPDGSVLTFRSAHSPNLARLGPWALLSTAVALFVGLCATLLMHRIGVPLRRLSEDTEKIGRGAWIAVAESGPRETRTIARALNAMQARIQALVAERTQALAAVSHDLRTPITRLRLRLGGELTEAERQAMSVDLDDMQAMIDSTLAYLRGEDDPEQPQRVNLSSLLTSIADAAWDTGRSVVFVGPPRTLAELRPVAFRRAVQNLVDNAVRYGGCARIALSTTASGLTVWIDDDGPGIAADDRKRVFEPFVRLETSRNRETGGSGLGLTIARRTIEQHGGSIALENRSPYDLRVELVLPRSGASAHDTF